MSALVFDEPGLLQRFGDDRHAGHAHPSIWAMNSWGAQVLAVRQVRSQSQARDAPRSVWMAFEGGGLCDCAAGLLMPDECGAKRHAAIGAR